MQLFGKRSFHDASEGIVKELDLEPEPEPELQLQLKQVWIWSCCSWSRSPPCCPLMEAAPRSSGGSEDKTPVLKARLETVSLAALSPARDASAGSGELCSDSALEVMSGRLQAELLPAGFKAQAESHRSKPASGRVDPKTKTQQTLALVWNHPTFTSLQVKDIIQTSSLTSRSCGSCI
ncbi:uncharacterized protein V6R79_007051 [Siganus canaliculatus]